MPVISSFSRGDDHAGQVDLAVLKSWDFSRWQTRYGGGWQLPYRMDHLASHGFRLRWTDKVHSAGWDRAGLARPLRMLESLTFPFVQTALMAPAIARSRIVLAMFESEANAVALARSLDPRRPRSALAVVTCWLAHVLTSCSEIRRAGYRRAYRYVDRIYYFSENQQPVLTELLGVDPARLVFIPFGVDDEMFVPPRDPDGGYALVVGRDRGRDWPTTFQAVRDIGMPVKVCCRRSDIAGLEIPSGVEVIGYVERDAYRRLLGRARVVLIATQPVVYPSGQSVLLEAMAMKRAVVVTDAPALRGYFRNGETALVAPVGDPAALRQRLLEAADDRELRGRLGEAGRAAVESSFSAKTMWAAVATDLLALGAVQER